MATMNLPENPSVSNSEVGKDFLIYVNTGTNEAAVWTLIGGQRSGSLGRTADEVDVSHKTSGGWKSVKAGLRSWSLDLDALVVLNDAGLKVLEYAFDNGKEINIKYEYPDKTFQSGWGSITDFSLEAPHDGEATIKGTISGNGPLSARTAA